MKNFFSENYVANKYFGKKMFNSEDAVRLMLKNTKDFDCLKNGTPGRASLKEGNGSNEKHSMKTGYIKLHKFFESPEECSNFLEEHRNETNTNVKQLNSRKFCRCGTRTLQIYWNKGLADESCSEACRHCQRRMFELKSDQPSHCLNRNNKCLGTSNFDVCNYCFISIFKSLMDKLKVFSKKCAGCDCVVYRSNEVKKHTTCEACNGFLFSYKKRSDPIYHKFCPFAIEFNRPKCSACRVEKLVSVNVLELNSIDNNLTLVYNKTVILKDEIEFLKNSECFVCDTQAELWFGELPICSYHSTFFHNWVAHKHGHIGRETARILGNKKVNNLDYSKLRQTPLLVEVMQLKMNLYQSYLKHKQDSPSYVHLNPNALFKFNICDAFNRNRLRFKELIMKNLLEKKNVEVMLLFFLLMETSQRCWYNVTQPHMVGIATLKKHQLKLTANNRILLKFIAKNKKKFEKEYLIDKMVYNHFSELLLTKADAEYIFVNVEKESKELLQQFLPDMEPQWIRTANATHHFLSLFYSLKKEWDDWSELKKLHYVIKSIKAVSLILNHDDEEHHMTLKHYISCFIFKAAIKSIDLCDQVVSDFLMYEFV